MVPGACVSQEINIAMLEKKIEFLLTSFSLWHHYYVKKEEYLNEQFVDKHNRKSKNNQKGGKNRKKCNYIS